MIWGVQLEGTDSEKDVGVMISNALKPSLQYANASKKANQVLGQMQRAVSVRDKYTFCKLYLDLYSTASN